VSGAAIYWLGEAAVSALIVIGAVFLLVGSYALAKLPDTMRRLHGPTKSATLGVGTLLIASMLHFLLAHGRLSFHELLIAIFLFLTAPVTALMVAKAHILRDHDRRRDLPPTGRPAGWATLDPLPEPPRQPPPPPTPHA
jgi:multicomponent K+:H+ antiporter subunit G